MIYFFFFVGFPWFSNPLNTQKDLLLLQDQQSNQLLQLQVWKEKCQLYVELDALTRAEELIEQLVVAFPGEPVFHDLKMMVLSENGDIDKAIEEGERILKRFPGYKPVYHNLGFVYFQKKGMQAKALNLMFSEKGNPLRLRDWAKISNTLNAAYGSRAAVLKFLLDKAESHPHQTRLNQLILAYLIRLGEYKGAELWITDHPALISDKEVENFIKGMDTFETP